MGRANLRRRRNHLGLTLKELGKECGMSPSYISELERGVYGGGEALETQERILAVLTDLDMKQRASTMWHSRPERKFEPGRAYLVEDQQLRYLRKEGKHHLFRGPGGGWLTAFTDAQFVGVTIREIKRRRQSVEQADRV